MTGAPQAPDPLASEMFAETVRDGQSARRIADDPTAERVRELLRRLGRTRGVRLRTARMDQKVVVARTDAEVWQDDQATMRAKLTPPD